MDAALSKPRRVAFKPVIRCCCQELYLVSYTNLTGCLALSEWADAVDRVTNRKDGNYGRQGSLRSITQLMVYIPLRNM